MPALKPKGVRCALYIDVRTLNPGAGEKARAERAPVYCGAIVGYVMGKGDNARHLKGDFLAVAADGEQITSIQAYLPEPLARELAAKLPKRRCDRVAATVPFAVMIFAEPDDRPRSRMGFRYAAQMHPPSTGAASMTRSASSGIATRCGCGRSKARP
jgi:hypothetical protein